ncbi:hypothetical protein [Aeromonas caviae]|uniref:hypothetical protein n=1 Tax=Aeromonas caviae TaxID=648 RepID=UPI001FBAB705|nr:hypothetical protein [Aeromonas caviae]GKR23696.1 hypothetical protein KAM468_24360 [Aeromonas caviae]GKR27925.1 hypothetical protein KAM469_23840 [Aeromonas caviae]GKR32334.1 hypothetical protein KAM470_24070 [Aeromonas caviae]GKR61756.1 hypothetical protein KAM477_23780 [Aeromonas caviae]GKR66214.1 hypothetical protein KAM478_24710 [Aeromonas caviae]
MLIQLTHLKALRYPKLTKRTAPPLPESVVDMARLGTTVVTFRPLATGKPDRTVKNVSAIERFSWISAQSLVVYGLESDSPLAPLILWDLAHAAPVGSTITLMGDHGPHSYLQRSYYAAALPLVYQNGDVRTFNKTAPLPAEADSGLDAWTFGIPVGPEDATLLNTTVKRILELDVPRKEILLCGRPGANFAYFDHVRIVGEDITAPPVQICAKKNRLAQEASHPNLCIIHDRVFLPRDFYRAVTSFGDHYPLTTFQSLFFDDRFNLVPRRYSDMGVSFKAKTSATKGIMRDNDAAAPNIFAPGVLPVTELSGFYAANVRRYVPTMYPTGSMYLCKRSVWLAQPQNENLHWIEFEDLEHAFRAADAGVPSRTNPFAITQSLISRPLLSRVGGSFLEPISGPPALIRPWTEALPVPRKPAIKATHAQALANLQKFADKYLSPDAPYAIPVSATFRSADRVKAILSILSRVEVPVSERAIRELVKDYDRWVIMDQLPFSQVEHICHRLLVDRASLVSVLAVENDILVNHIAARPKKGTFATSLSDYLPSRSPLVVAGSLFSGLCLFLRRKRVLYLKGGPLAYARAILNTTPYKEA